MKYTQDNGKIKLCEKTDNMDHLVRLTQALNENNILYETRLKKKRTFINNLFFLIFYHTFASGIDHKNETTCIYVLEKDFAAAQKAIVNWQIKKFIFQGTGSVCWPSVIACVPVCQPKPENSNTTIACQ